MTDQASSSIEVDGPVGYDVEGHGPGNPGREPPDFVGLREHGHPSDEPGVSRRTIASGVWGSEARVNVEHGTTATWDPCHDKNPSTCCPGKVTRCCWYGYAEDLCMKGCVHPGMDIGVAKHTPLYAAEGGTVEFAGWAGVYRPHFVSVRTPSGELHIYGHMWSVDPQVRTGGRVQAGQYLGTSGEQTKAGTPEPDGSGPHLHFERRKRLGQKECAVDPEPVLRAAPVAYCKPDPPPPFDGTVKTVNGVVFHPDRRTVRCTAEGLRCRRWANRQACQTREPLANGETIAVDYWIRGEAVNGVNRWWVATKGFRIWGGGTDPTPGDDRTSGG